MDQVNIAILGYGFMGKVYRYAANSLNDFYPNMPKINVDTVLVSQQKSLKEIETIKKRYNFKTVTQSITDIVNDKSIDAVYVASPNNFHHDQVKKCILAGKHVLCEKPMSTNIEESAEMLRLSQSAGVVANMVFEYRFTPAISKIKELIESGALGDIIQFRALYLHGSYIEERPITWRLQEGTGGALVDLGPHLFDLINFLMGKFKITHSKKVKKMPGRKVDDIAWMLCETENQADGYIEVSRLASGSVDDLRLEIHGTKGSVKWNLDELNYFQFYRKDEEYAGYKKVPCFRNELDLSDFPPAKVSSGWLMAHLHCLHNFVAEISDPSFNDPRTARFSDGHYVQTLINTVEQ